MKSEILIAAYTNETRDILADLGLALHQWSLVERTLQHIFRCCFFPSSQQAAMRAYVAVHSLEVRISMASEALSTVETLPNMGDWPKLRRRLRDQSKKRNNLAHFGLVLFDTPQDTGEIRVVPHAGSHWEKEGDWGALNQQDIRSYSETWSALRHSLEEFLASLKKHRNLKV